MLTKGMSRKVTFKAVILQIAFVVCLMLTGVNHPALGESAGANKSGQPTGQQDMEQAVKDAWIQGKLEGVYLFNEHLSPFAINTEVSNGMVQLTGTVGSEVDKELAGEIAKGIDGVREVDNRLAVEASGVKDKDEEKTAEARDRSIDRNGARARETESENKFVRWVGDATITAVIKSKLLANENISGMDISVDTENSRVTLSGEVESDEARQLAEEIAENTEDVVEVENNLKVAGRVADIE